MRFMQIVVAASLACVGALSLAADDWPVRPVKFLVPWPAGGLNDVIARAVNDTVARNLGQAVITDFRPGAAGRVGVAEIVRSKPDGYTIGMGNLGPLTIFPSLYKDMQYNVKKDVVPVTMFAVSPLVLVVPATSPFQNAQEFVAEMKSKPGRYNFASVGLGSPQHLVFELVKGKTGLHVVHIPYKGPNETIPALLSGDVQSMFEALPTMLPQIKAGKLRALAVTTRDRVPQLPDVPTLKELGLSDVDVVSWYALIVPTGTPTAIVDRLYTEYSKAASSPDIRRLLESQGLIYLPNTQAQFQARIEEETARWAKVIRDNKIEVTP